MRKVIAHLILTLDGVAKLDPTILPLIKTLRNADEVLPDFFAKVAKEDAMLLGRVTYQEWASYWPTSTSEPFSSHINSVPKYVVSRTLDSAPWPGRADATLIKDGLADAITTLKRQPGKNIGIHGSPTLVESMLHADLLDELRVEICPVVAGSGPRLFRDGRGTRPLRLMDSIITKNGVAILTYQPMKDAARG